jgi:hypothetical protein
VALTFQNDTAIHEAGHCIIAYLAQEVFEIKFVTINSTLSKAQDLTSLGGLRGSLIKNEENLLFQDHDLMILMCMAGMASDDINHGNGLIDEELYENSSFAKKLNSNKYSGDAKLILPHLQRLVPELSVDQRTYTVSCQKLLHELFMTDWVTNILIGLRNKISNTSNQTITGIELVKHLDSTKLKHWKENDWTKIVEDRINKYEKRHTTKPIPNKGFIAKLKSWFS